MPDGPDGFWREWEAGRWEPETRAALARLLTPETTYLDIGAWIGPTVLWAAPLCRRVIALEPDPVAFVHLTHNVAGLPNVACYAFALAPESGITQLYHRGAFGDSMSSLVPTGEDAMSVPTITPAVLLGNVEPPAVAKVDIEGGEALVLPDLAPLLVERQIPLLLSVHEPYSGPGGPERIAEAVSLFATTEVLADGGGGFSELLCLPEGV